MRQVAQTEERLRFTQGLSAILLIAAYVFDVAWVPLFVACALGVGIAVGPQAEILAWPFDNWIARLVKRSKPVSESKSRLVTVATVVLVASSSLLWAAGLVGVSQLLILIAAGASALYATTGIIAITAIESVIRSQR